MIFIHLYEIDINKGKEELKIYQSSVVPIVGFDICLNGEKYKVNETHQSLTWSNDSPLTEEHYFVKITKD